MGMSLVLSLQGKKKKSPKSTRRVRGRKRLRIGDDLVSTEIPLELQIEILTRLPPKSLMRFKCVSKLYFSLIRSRYFSNLYYTVASPPRPPLLYMSFMEHLTCDSMEVCQNPGKSLLVSLSSSSSDNGSESFDQDLSMPGLGGQGMVFFRGLILYMACTKACIYNPTTRQKLALPPVKYCFGYDPVVDQYKVVCNVATRSEDYERITSEHWVFVLEAGGFWKRIGFEPKPHIPTRLGMCINGVIHYLADTSISCDIVVSFDVRSEEFSIIQAPHDVSESAQFVWFIEHSGKPAILDYTHLQRKGSVELWVLEDGGKWWRKSLVLQPCHMHLVNNRFEFKVLGTTPKGEVILAADPIYPPYYYILCYDLQKNELRKVNIIISGIPRSFSKLNICFQPMDKSENIIHLEA